MRRVRYNPSLPTLPGGERQVPNIKLPKADALALKELAAIEAALLLRDWSAVRSAAIKLAALADSRVK